MSEVLYDAHPSMIRSRPFAVLLAFAAMPFGVALAVMGGSLVPEAAPVMAVLGLLIAAFGFLTLMFWYVRAKADHLVIKDEEIVWTHGLLNKGYTEISLASVRTTRLHQTLLQRIMNAGDIEIYTSGDIPELTVKGLPNPSEVLRVIKGQPPQAQPAAGA